MKTNAPTSLAVCDRAVGDVGCARICGCIASKARGGQARVLKRRRPALRAGSPALLATRGRLRNSLFCPLRGQRCSAILAVPPQAAGNPRCAALLGAAHSHPDLLAPSLAGSGSSYSTATTDTPGAQARGWCPDGAHVRRRAAQCSKGKPGVPAGPARSLDVGAAFSGGHGGIAAALSERAAQRTLGAAEGGAAKLRQGTTLGPRAHVTRAEGLRQAQPERSRERRQRAASRCQRAASLHASLEARRNR